MNIFFEESGEFKAANVLSQTGEAFQAELPSGKRAKVKAKDVFFQFTSPDAAHWLEQAQKLSAELDLNFLWEVADKNEFHYEALAKDYFSENPHKHELAALLMALHSAPIYFQKKGKGNYKPAAEDNVRAALAGIEKKKQLLIIQNQYTQELKEGRLPASFSGQVWQLLFKPDKNGVEYKALQVACQDLQMSATDILLKCGAIRSAKDFHLSRFLFEYFPKGTGFGELEKASFNFQLDDLSLAESVAFSIDDSTTTEIDDAFSFKQIDADKVRVGIHIAAPALCIQKDSDWDKLARSRMSTVYMPGDKITMLPDVLVKQFSLDENQIKPCISLYVDLQISDWSILGTETKIEKIKIASNLRHDVIDDVVTAENLSDDAHVEFAFSHELKQLWKWAQILEAQRMEKRVEFGLKAEQKQYQDFSFYVENEVVNIVPRKRHTPLDKIVAELMIFTNMTWGKFLGEAGVAGIFRTQGTAPWPNKMLVKMLTYPAPHIGLGVDAYIWGTSPLRRYTDLVNQMQLIARVQNGVTASLAAPYKVKDAHLFAIVSGFDALYTAYAHFQAQMERYWCLRWIGQGENRTFSGILLKEDVIKLLEIPLVIKMAGIPTSPRGSSVQVEIMTWDEMSLEVQARLVHIQATSSENDEILFDDEESSDTQTAVLAIPALNADNDVVKSEDLTNDKDNSNTSDANPILEQ